MAFPNSDLGPAKVLDPASPRHCDHQSPGTSFGALRRATPGPAAPARIQQPGAQCEPFQAPPGSPVPWRRDSPTCGSRGGQHQKQRGQQQQWCRVAQCWGPGACMGCQLGSHRGATGRGLPRAPPQPRDPGRLEPRVHCAQPASPAGVRAREAVWVSVQSPQASRGDGGQRG